MRCASPSRGFSLIEMLVVIAILATLAGMMTYNFAKPEVRRQSVRLAAEELAATFRKARVLAMERKAVHAVVFHIQNKPGSSGIVLNNRSGGHWYRILGPATSDIADRNQTIDNLPPVAIGGYAFKPHNVAETGELINRAWVEEPHILAAGKVRFLALNDMDYGDIINPWGGTYRGISASDSYPRPWFGWYDAATKRLYPWGGYDPAIVGSGFYYWGTSKTNGAVVIATADPAPVGSTNPVARILDHWSNGQTNESYNQMPAPTHPASQMLYDADTPRPVINSDWRDCSIAFLSTGEVRWGGWMPARHSAYMMDGVVKTIGTPVKRGVHDRCNGTNQVEADSFDRDSGGWFITLSPDALDDDDRFDTAQQALDSLSPMYRVFVSRAGEVKVIPVSRKPDFAGMTAFPPTPTWWRSVSNMQRYFPSDRLVSGTILDAWGAGIGPAQGKPITDFVTPEMLSGRQVWMR